MSIEDNIKSVRKSIAVAAEASGRLSDSVRLIAVSKTKPIKMIEEAISAGMRDFGENKPQEIVEKFSRINAGDLRWHMIGHLQKNKVRHIIDKVFMIHSVDSLELADEIEKRAAQIDKIQNILIQVNISGEESKSGIAPDELESFCRSISTLPHISVKGLMTISSAYYTDEQNTELFKKLKALSENIKALKINNVSMDELSMGMSGDYKEAIAAGATMVRVGTGIFGMRDYSVN